jgi:hypothetical protein
MGMCASFYLMPRAAFERCRVDPRGDHFPSGATAFDIDKAHTLFHVVFREMPAPLNRAVEGDLCPHGGLDDPGDDATHIGYVSPEAVRVIAQALARIDLPQMFQSAQQLGWSWAILGSDWDYYKLNWQSLRKAYRTAARDGCALAVLMC